MRMPLLLVIIIAICALRYDADAAEGPAWNRNIEEAKALAESEDKALFILFTGHGWCHACEVLDRQVFRTEEFVDATADKYVFVEMDFNFGDGPEEAKRKSELIRLRSHYLAPAVPAAVLADADGAPYAFITGYEVDSGPNSYLGYLATAETAKEKRDNLLLAARSTSGLSRAKLLDDALDCVAGALGDIDDRGDDPLLRFYDETIQEILQLTRGEGAIAEKYTARRDRRTAWLSSEAIFAKLKEFDAAKDYAGAISYIDSRLMSAASDSIRWRLEVSRQIHLEWSKRYGEALANCQRLLALESIPEEHRDYFLDREAFNLFCLDRVAEGLSHYDRRISDAAEDSPQRLKLLSWKAQMILGREPVSESISAWQAYRRETKPGTEDWSIATVLLARELRRANRHEDALRVLADYLKVNRAPWLLLDAVESHIALKNFGEAREYLGEAQAAIQGLADASRQSERRQYEGLVARIEKLTGELVQRSVSAK